MEKGDKEIEFKSGDIVVVEKYLYSDTNELDGLIFELDGVDIGCSGNSNDCKLCDHGDIEIRLFRIKGDPSLICEKEIRKADDREEFLYRMYGSEALREKI